MKQIAKALLEAQKEMSDPVKNSKNPFLKNSYADLNSVREAVIPTLNSHGISVIQPMAYMDGRNFVKTVLLHESGEMLESFTEIVYAKVGDAQGQGSGISYARRYGLQSMVCVGAVDDDGNKASEFPKAAVAPTPKPVATAPQVSGDAKPIPTVGQFNSMLKKAATDKEFVKARIKDYTFTDEQRSQLDKLLA